MGIEDALFSRLSGNAGVAALVGNRIYPNLAPQEASLPAIVYQAVGTERNYSHGGQSNTAERSVQLTILATSYSQALAVAAATRAALSGYRGTVGSTEIRGVFCENEFDGYNLDTGIQTRRQDFNFQWKEV